MKHEVYLDGKLLDEVTAQPGWYVTQEVCLCGEVGETCHVDAIYEQQYRVLRFATNCMEYHYTMIGAYPVHRAQ